MHILVLYIVNLITIISLFCLLFFSLSHSQKNNFIYLYKNYFKKHFGLGFYFKCSWYMDKCGVTACPLITGIQAPPITRWMMLIICRYPIFQYPNLLIPLPTVSYPINLLYGSHAAHNDLISIRRSQTGSSTLLPCSAVHSVFTLS